jgi:peptide/nickel transport system substrate-binding protein
MVHIAHWQRRRQQRRTRLAALVVAAVVLAAACGGDDDDDAGEVGGGETTPDTSTGSTGTDSNGEVNNPGVIVQALGIEPNTLDPAAVSNAGAVGVIHAYEPLVDVGPAGPELLPVLASEVPTVENGGISADGLTYTFKPRDGVVFHDGTPMTAEDVKFSWDRAMTMNLPDTQAQFMVDIVDETRVVDELTFEVTLKQAVAWFLNSVVTSYAAHVVSKATVEANGGVVEGEPNEWMTTNMNGTGPLIMSSWDRNEQMSFEKFADYWGEPAMNNGRYEFVPDSAANSLGLLAGDYDVIEPEAGYIPELENQDGVCITEEGTLVEPVIAAFNLNIDEAALPDEDTIPADFFHDVRIRQAFNYAYNYEQFIGAGLNGYGATATYIPPALFGYDPEGPRYTYDPARAEELFKEAGVWDEGFTLTVLTEGGHSVFEPAALLLKDNLEALNPNFRINVAALTEAQFDDAFAQDPFPYAMWFKNADAFRDPHFLFAEYHDPDGTWGSRLGYRNGYADPDGMSAAIDEALAETDEGVRFDLYGDLQQRVFDDPMWMWLGEESNLQMYRCWINNFEFNPLWTVPRLHLLDK